MAAAIIDDGQYGLSSSELEVLVNKLLESPPDSLKDLHYAALSVIRSRGPETCGGVKIPETAEEMYRLGQEFDAAIGPQTASEYEEERRAAGKRAEEVLLAISAAPFVIEEDVHVIALGRIALGVGKKLELRVLKTGSDKWNAEGFYIGTKENDDKPFSRESKELFQTREEADTALATGTWTQRYHS